MHIHDKKCDKKGNDKCSKGKGKKGHLDPSQVPPREIKEFEACTRKKTVRREIVNCSKRRNEVVVKKSNCRTF